MAFDKDAIIASLKEASISDLNDLVKAIEDEFDVSAAAPVAVAGAAGGDAAAKDSFTVELTEPGTAKVKVIKAVKDITGSGLKDAKDLVDNAPSVIKEDAKEDEANDIKAKLEDAGATVTLKQFPLPKSKDHQFGGLFLCKIFKLVGSTSFSVGLTKS